MRISYLYLFASLAVTTFLANARPNIVLIMADDVGYECFGSYGSREYSTPRLDALAEEGYVSRVATPRRFARRAGSI